MIQQNNTPHILSKSPFRADEGLFFRALTLKELPFFIHILQQIFSPQELKDLSNQSEKTIKTWIINNLSIQHYQDPSKGWCTRFIKCDLISFYYFLIQEDKKQIEINKSIAINVKNSVDVFCKIYQANNFAKYFKLFFSENKEEQQKTYTNHFIQHELIQLNIIPELSLSNFDECLTLPMRDLLFEIYEQKNKKQIENLYTAVSLAIANNFASKKDKFDLYKDVLFKSNNDFDSIIEQNRKAFLLNEYIEGDKKANDLLILKYTENKKTTRVLYGLAVDENQL